MSEFIAPIKLGCFNYRLIGLFNRWMAFMKRRAQCILKRHSETVLYFINAVWKSDQWQISTTSPWVSRQPRRPVFFLRYEASGHLPFSTLLLLPTLEPGQVWVRAIRLSRNYCLECRCFHRGCCNLPRNRHGLPGDPAALCPDPVAGSTRWGGR